jgi:capping protein alpha
VFEEEFEEEEFEEEDYEEASPEQKLSIATYFIMSSPVGEVDFVTADTKNWMEADILNDDAVVNILKEYNIEQLTKAVTPDGHSSIVSSYGMVTPNEYLDPTCGKVLTFDHKSRQFTGVTEKKSSVPDDVDAQRNGIQQAMNLYLDQKYKAGKACCVVYGHDDGSITVCISASNTKISSYWTGAWKSIYTFSTSKAGDTEMSCSIKVHVHYFEDGNVQLHSAFDKKVTIVVGEPDKTGKSVAKTIDTVESDFQSSIEKMYVDMHDKTFKEMRRFLPITKQPMKWNDSAHGVGLK